MTTLREEIDNIMLGCKYDIWSPDSAWKKGHYTDIVLKLIGERVDGLKTKHPGDLYRAYNAGLDDVKEVLSSKK